MFELMVELTQRKYLVGYRVHVREGVRDPDFPETSISGWTGTIAQVESGDAPYLIRWDHDTLRNTNPAHRARCAYDDLAFDEMWLAEDDLVLDMA